MFLQSLQLTDFRNFERAELEFSPSFNLLVGKNAQGKTNIIEALGLLASGRSFRTSEFRDMIRRERPAATVSAMARGEAGEDRLRVSLDGGRKGFFRNEKRTTPGGFSGLRSVLFAPEEILLLRESPVERRRYADRLIAATDPDFRGVSRRYERVVGHRNRLLQEAAERGRLDSRALDGWDEQLAGLGSRIAIARARLCDELCALLPEAYARIAQGDGAAAFCYRPHCGTGAIREGEGAVAEAILEGLSRRRADELRRGVTLVGPHRDDFEATIGERPVRQFGSQGQHRTFVVAFKIAEIELLRRADGEAPLILLDDVASELDIDRSRSFFDYLKEVRGQVFVTATDADAVRLGQPHSVRRFFIDAGSISS